MTAAIVKKTELKIVVIDKKIATTIAKMHETVRTTVKTIAMTDKMADRIIAKIDVTEESKHLFTDFKNKKNFVKKLYFITRSHYASMLDILYCRVSSHLSV